LSGDETENWNAKTGYLTPKFEQSGLMLRLSKNKSMTDGCRSRENMNDMKLLRVT